MAASPRVSQGTIVNYKLPLKLVDLLKQRQLILLSFLQTLNISDN